MSISSPKKKIAFNRNEFAGSFGDIGTDFPLIVGMILIADLHVASVLVMFGLAQIFTGLFYRLPMPVQPLKAMAVIVITQKISADVLYGGGLAVGLIMAVLVLTGLITWIGNTVPKCVIRGIQLGLGLKLASLALGNYVQSEGLEGYILAGLAFVVTLFLLKSKKYPAALVVILIGVIYALFNKVDHHLLGQSFALHIPQVHCPKIEDILTGCVVLAIPQLALSIGNSVLATNQLVKDYFPDEKMSVKRIGLTYGIINIIKPFLGGIPVCHGSGGMAGHYTFGGRTGGSVIIYGGLYLTLGLFFSQGFSQIIQLFPRSILGIILFFEGLALIILIKDLMKSKKDLSIALIVGLVALNLPYGYVIGLVGGTILALLVNKNIVKTLN